MNVLYIFISDMDIEAHLRGHYDKKSNEKLNTWVGDSQERFDDFMPFFFHEEMRICQRASWTLGKVCAERPWLMEKWFPQILVSLDHPKHDAIVRNVVRALQEVEVYPEEYEGEIFERCFGYLVDHNSPIAFKAFSMRICRKIAMKYPDLKAELISVIEELVIHGSAGVRSRGHKELAILRKK